MNTAVRVWVPLVNVEMVRKAKPAVTDFGGPRRVVPSLNWTVPAAVKGDGQELLLSIAGHPRALRVEQRSVGKVAFHAAGGVIAAMWLSAARRAVALSQDRLLTQPQVHSA
jgi:hypothetical protein